MNKWKWHCISCKTSPLMMNSLSFVYSPFGKHSFAGCSILVWQFFFFFPLSVLSKTLGAHAPLSFPWGRGMELYQPLSVCCFAGTLEQQCAAQLSCIVQRTWGSRDLEYITSHQCSEAGERYQSSGSLQKRWNAGYMFQLSLSPGRSQEPLSFPPCMMHCAGGWSMGSECLETVPLFSVTSNPVLFLNSA